MKSFRDVSRLEPRDEKMDYLASRIALDDAEGAFVEAGELEQGILDALHPQADGWGETEQLLRLLSRWTGAAYRASREDGSSRELLARARRTLARLERRELPERLEVHPPEGYIHYALDPVGYARAAARYAADVGRERAARAVVIGVRSVGTSLSGIVAAELHTARTATVRPRGRAGGRRVAAASSLRNAVLEWLGDGGDALVVDEGPGATGDTFACVVGWLRALGVSSERIVLLPSHLGSPGLAAGPLLEFFGGSRRYPPDPAEDRVDRVRTRFGLSEPEDLSAGRWRAVVPEARQAVAVPAHERLKYRARRGDGGRWLIRYGGLGRTGMEAALRAHTLGALGLTPVMGGRQDGFLLSAWIEGPALSPREARSPGFLRTLVGYLSARIGLFRTGRAVDVGPVLAMLEENGTEALGPAPRGLAEALRRLEALPGREAVIADARLQPHEWIRSNEGWVKTDATDHGDSVRLPGPTDPAWDLAGAAVELGARPELLEEMVRACGRAAPGGRLGLAAAVDAYRAPYAACQLGELAIAAREIADGPEGGRLRAEAARYRMLLHRELARLGRVGAPHPRHGAGSS